MKDASVPGGVGTLEGVTTAISNPTSGSRRYLISCDTGSAVYQRNATLAPGAAAVDPLVLRAIALSRVQVPTTQPGSNPDLSDPDRFGVVHIPVWLWIESPVTDLQESETQLGVTVEVTATPTGVTWEMGNGDTEPCAMDELVVWQPGLSDDDTECKYTYTKSSAGLPGDAYEINAAVTWEFSWTIDGAPQGSFGTYQALTPFPYQVGEIQAIETSDS